MLDHSMRVLKAPILLGNALELVFHLRLISFDIVHLIDLKLARWLVLMGWHHGHKMTAHLIIFISRPGDFLLDHIWGLSSLFNRGQERVRVLVGESSLAAISVKVHHFFTKGLAYFCARRV